MELVAVPESRGWSWHAIPANVPRGEGRLTHTYVFDEKTVEVLAAETDEDIRKELVQVGAMCLKWVADIDARQKA
jgi:hypothetical protein